MDDLLTILVDAGIESGCIMIFVRKSLENKFLDYLKNKFNNNNE